MTNHTERQGEGDAACAYYAWLSSTGQLIPTFPNPRCIPEYGLSICRGGGGFVEQLSHRIR